MYENIQNPNKNCLIIYDFGLSVPKYIVKSCLLWFYSVKSMDSVTQKQND